MLRDNMLEEVQEDTVPTLLEEWLDVLSRLWTYYDKQIDPVRLVLYQNSLSKVPLGLLELAVERTVQEHKYNSVPIVGQVWAAIREELGNPYDLDQALAEWKNKKLALFESCIYRGPIVANGVARGVAAETEA
jgi:hypothetical protein